MFRRIAARTASGGRRRFFTTDDKSHFSVAPSRSFLLSDQASVKNLVDRLAMLDKRLSYEGWHTLRWTSLALAIGTSLFWLFRDNVSKGAGEAASEVTRRTLEDQGVQQQASELARGVVYELLNDEKALALSSQFIYTVLQRPEIQEATLMLVKDVLQRPETEVVVRSLVREVLIHPESAATASQFVANLVALPETRNSMIQLIHSVQTQAYTKQITAEFFSQVMATEEFVNQTNALGSNTMHHVLNDEQLKLAAISWMNAVLNDPALQSTAGDAVWAAVKGAFVPWGKPKGNGHKPLVSNPAVNDILKTSEVLEEEEEMQDEDKVAKPAPLNRSVEDRLKEVNVAQTA
ncbi:hypothetical protein BASA81_001708 [Batrachochytrium salamandrivorans]|nr:hypothetical protein BASA81_001708 [Batrachochytrium salamandrivorans]